MAENKECSSWHRRAAQRGIRRAVEDASKKGWETPSAYLTPVASRDELELDLSKPPVIRIHDWKTPDGTRVVNIIRAA